MNYHCLDGRRWTCAEALTKALQLENHVRQGPMGRSDHIYLGVMVKLLSPERAYRIPMGHKEIMEKNNLFIEGEQGGYLKGSYLVGTPMGDRNTNPERWLMGRASSSYFTKHLKSSISMLWGISKRCNWDSKTFDVVPVLSTRITRLLLMNLGFFMCHTYWPRN